MVPLAGIPQHSSPPYLRLARGVSISDALVYNCHTFSLYQLTLLHRPGVEVMSGKFDL